MRDAEVRGPGAVFVLPAGVDMVELVVVLEVRAVDGELVKGVEHAFHAVAGRPGIRAGALEHEHAVVDSRAGKRTHCVLQRVRRVCVRRRAEDDIPFSGDVVDFRSPELEELAFHSCPVAIN